MITNDILYLGVNDRDIDLFEGQYIVPEGISYNSYLIMDEKTAVMDTVDQRKKEEYLTNLENALKGRCPDYLEGFGISHKLCGRVLVQKGRNAGSMIRLHVGDYQIVGASAL